MMIGNGVTNWTYDTQPATFNMTYWHAIMGEDMYDQLNDNQCDFSMMNFGKLPNRTCLDIFSKFQKLTSCLDMYNIFNTPTCSNEEEESVAKTYMAGDQILEVTDEQPVKKRSKTTFRDYTPWMVGPFKDSTSY